jgi:hypothetical protein
MPMTAICRRRRWSFLLPWRRRTVTLDHAPPAPECRCGIYAATTLAAAMRWFAYVPTNGAPRVIGRVALWGKVTECELGWRATRAYPESLHVLADDSGRMYGFARPRHRLAEARATASSLAAYDVPVDVIYMESRGLRRLLGGTLSLSHRVSLQSLDVGGSLLREER